MSVCVCARTGSFIFIVLGPCGRCSTRFCITWFIRVSSGWGSVDISRLPQTICMGCWTSSIWPIMWTWALDGIRSVFVISIAAPTSYYPLAPSTPISSRLTSLCGYPHKRNLLFAKSITFLSRCPCLSTQILEFWPLQILLSPLYRRRVVIPLRWWPHIQSLQTCLVTWDLLTWILTASWLAYFPLTYPNITDLTVEI